MSKLADRLPSVTDTSHKLELATTALPGVVDEDGRIDLHKLVDAVNNEIEGRPVNVDLIVKEGRKAAAHQIVSAFTNARTIRLDRTMRVPVYQAQFGFAESYFKIGSVLVPPVAMTKADFELMLERQDRRIENAQTDRSIWWEFYERARPGLERGESLIQQFEAGTLELVSANGTPELEAADEE